MVGLRLLGADTKLALELLSSDPQRPSKGDNTWVVELQSFDSSPLSAPKLEIFPFMPDHGHGTTLPPLVRPLGNAQFEISELNLWMPGFWTMRFDVEAEGMVDEMSLPLCVE